MEPMLLVGAPAAAYYTGAALAFLAVCVITHGFSTRRSRSLLRAVTFALLLTPIGFGVHTTAVFIVPLSALLTSSLHALVALGLMIMTGGVAYFLLGTLPKDTSRGRELLLIATPLMACAVIVAAMASVDAYRAWHLELEWREAALRNQQERARSEATGVPVLHYLQDLDAVIVLPRPSTYGQDYALEPPAGETQLRFRLDAVRFADNEIVSLRNPRTMESTSVGKESVAELTVMAGDIVLVTMEQEPQASKSAALLGAEPLAPTVEGGN